MRIFNMLLAVALLGLATSEAAANGRSLSQATAAAAPAPAASTSQPPLQAAAEAIRAIATSPGTTTTYPIGGKEGKDLPRLVAPTFKFAFKDDVGAFQGWNGGLELPKVIDLGGVRTTRSGLRGRKLSQAAATAPAPASSTSQPPLQAAAEAIEAIATSPGTTTTYPIGGKEGKDLPRLVAPTFKFAFKDDVGAFQGWNGGLELPKVIDLGGVRTTRSGLRGRKLSQAAATAPAPAASTSQPPLQAAAEAIRAIATSPGTTTTYLIGGKEGKDLPRLVAPTFKFAFKDDVGAFQGWNGGLELPKVIDLGGVRTTRSGLRGRKLSQAAATAPAPASSTSQPPLQAAAEAIEAIATSPGTTTTYPIGGKEGKDLPRLVAPTFKFAFKDDVGAFQGWNGGLELPKVIDLGGVRTTRSGLRGRKLSQAAATAPAPAASTSQPPLQAAAEAIEAIATSPGTTTTYPIGGKEGKDLPRLVAPTFKFAFKDDVGAFQGWNGGLELPKVIDLGGVRTTRSGLRGKKMQ